MYINIEKMLPQNASLENSIVHSIKGWVFGYTKVSKIQVTIGDKTFEASDKYIYRPDVLVNHFQVDRKLHSLFSGFRVPILLEPVSHIEQHDVRLQVTFKNGEKHIVELGTITLSPPISNAISLKAFEKPISEGLIAICMTTYNPDIEQFQRQVESIINQDYENWICIVSDDCSKWSIRKKIKDILLSDPRFIFMENEQNLGFYHNFERCLTRVPQEATYVALSDQDDYWYPQKLRLCVEKLDENERTALVYSDMRIVKQDGTVIYDSYWIKRKNYYKIEDLDLLTIANTVTGAASMFKADLLKKIMPFPPRNGDVYHDQWIALIASMYGGIEYINQPLYDYTQSGDNVIGHVDFGRKSLLRMLKEMKPFQDILKRKKSSFIVKLKLFIGRFVDLMVFVYNFKHVNTEHITTLRENAEQRVDDSKLIKLLQRSNSLGGLWKVHRKVQKRKETLNNLETKLLISLLVNKYVKVFVIPMRRVIRRLTQSVQQAKVSSLQDSISYTPLTETVRHKVDSFAVEYKRKFRGRQFVVSSSERPRVNLLISQIDPNNFFGGYIGMYNVAKKFYELGYSIRILLTDQTDFSDEDLVKIKRHDGRLKNFLSETEFAICYSTKQVITISEKDMFIASSWWTAYLAQEATQQTLYKKFVFLIQDYEPIFYDHGSYRVLADNSYKLNYYPIFSTDVLQQYFIQEGIISSSDCGIYFRNPILKFDLSEQKALRTIKKEKKKLLFYARIQPHNARNLFALGCLAIDRARELGGFLDEEWEVIGIGSDEFRQVLPSGVTIEHIGKFSIDQYEEMLPKYDLGLSLMDSPHPSLLPVELASAGLLVVTNTYGIKNAEYFNEISTNIKAVPSDIDCLAYALIEQAAKVEHYEQRIQGSKVNWPHDWDEVLHREELLNVIRNVEYSVKVNI